MYIFKIEKNYTAENYENYIENEILNKTVIYSSFLLLKKEHGKIEEKEGKKNTEIEMNQFQERVTTNLKELL